MCQAAPRTAGRFNAAIADVMFNPPAAKCYNKPVGGRKGAGEAREIGKESIKAFQFIAAAPNVALRHRLRTGK